MPEGTRMAGNDWINSYLEAILDVGPGLVDDAKSSLLLRERGHFSPTRYFVEEVITGFDETDLHRSWVRAAATRSPQERNTRLENLCWRIWNLARQKKQLEEKEAQRMTKRRLERERGRREATADMSEDLSEGEKGDVVASDVSAHGDSVRGRLPRINSVDAMETFISQQKGKKLYIVLISLHGLIRGENMELGRDSDTGGQVKYVVELARALGSMPGVYRVDLLTRQVSSPDVDWSYGEPTEMLTPLSAEGFEEETGESSGSYIIRIPFGPRDKYIPKENLWPHIPEFVDGALNHVIQMSKVLGEQVGGGKPVWPVAIHGHYADAGDSAALLSGALNVPMLFTGHSLGRDKLEQLLKQGRLSRDEINATYKIMRRIEAEELSLDASEIVITSTRQEIDEQWRLYDGFDPILERKIRARIRRNVSCYGRFMPRMVVIPPGMEFHHIVPQDGDMDGETEANEDHHPTPADPPIWTEIMRFFTNPRKPMILALARPDPKKNITTLVKAFGECRPLRELANLTLIMGNRDGIDDMSSTSASVLLSVLKLIDKHDLYGQVAYPKHHKQSDVPEIYRLAAKTKGVFINPAFIEPFGLTLIEAAAYGLPIVATKNGGPVDIIQVLDNGLLIDPHDQQSIADALLKLVADKQLWARCRQNGLKNIHLYSWPEHCKTYLSRIASCKTRHPQWQRSDDGAESSESDSPSDSLRDIQDLSLNLKFSMDGERSGISVNENSLESEGSIDRKSKIENAVLAWSKGISRDTRKAGFSEKADHNSSGKFPVLRRRKHIIVIAVDCDTITDLIETTKKIFEATEKERTEGSIGYILSTSLTIIEIRSFLVSGGLGPNDFDAFICNSGSDLYYPSINSDDRPFVVDFYYHSHIEYRWGGEGLRKTLVRWATSTNDKKSGSEEQIVTASEQLSTDYCYAFKVQKPALVPPVKELRKLLRIQALRCHVIYCQNGNRLNVIPVTASRSQALRYLYLRWGVELSKMVVVAGECGDTDYEGLLGGLHKSVVLKGVGSNAISQLHTNRNYPLSDVLAFDSPNIVQTTEGCDSDDIRVLFKSPASSDVFWPLDNNDAQSITSANSESEAVQNSGNVVLDLGSTWNPITWLDLLHTAKAMLPARAWNSLSPDLYATFWGLTLYDLYVPRNCYESEIAKQQASLKVLEEQPDNSISAITKRKKEKERIQDTIDRLTSELRKHEEHVASVRKRLSREKDKWLSSCLDTLKINMEFLQRCIFPRCTFSMPDAVYCAMFVHTLHSLGTPFFNTVNHMDVLICRTLQPMICCCTESEVGRLGKFLCETLKIAYYWKSDESIYERECGNMPGFAVYYRFPDSQRVRYGQFVKVHWKWSQRITRLLGQCLESPEYMEIRNALIILSRISSVFPVTKKSGMNLERRVSKIKGDGREDLKVLATSVGASLAARKPSLVSDEEFCMGYVELKSTASSKPSASNSGAIQSGPAVNNSQTEPVGGRAGNLVSQHSELINSARDHVSKTKPADGRLERAESISTAKSDQGHLKLKGASLVNGSDAQASVPSATLQSGTSRPIESQVQVNEISNRTPDENMGKLAAKNTSESELRAQAKRSVPAGAKPLKQDLAKDESRSGKAAGATNASSITANGSTVSSSGKGSASLGIESKVEAGSAKFSNTRIPSSKEEGAEVSDAARPPSSRFVHSPRHDSSATLSKSSDKLQKRTSPAEETDRQSKRRKGEAEMKDFEGEARLSDRERSVDARLLDLDKSGSDDRSVYKATEKASDRSKDKGSERHDKDHRERLDRPDKSRGDDLVERSRDRSMERHGRDHSAEKLQERGTDRSFDRLPDKSKDEKGKGRYSDISAEKSHVDDRYHGQSLPPPPPLPPHIVPQSVSSGRRDEDSDRRTATTRHTQRLSPRHDEKERRRSEENSSISQDDSKRRREDDFRERKRDDREGTSVKVEERDREREREREKEREKANLLKEDSDSIAASKRRKLKREHLASGEAGEYSPVHPPPPLSINLSQSYDGRDRGERKGPIVTRTGYMEESSLRIHGKEVSSKMTRRDTDPMYDWDDDKRQRGEQKRRHRKN